jgi:hypothetical protein
MHPLYFVFVRHFTILPTCFDPCGSSSGHLIHDHLQVIIVPHTKYTIHLKLVLATDYYKDLYV